jgi:iron complex outermembrane receptor protein
MVNKPLVAEIQNISYVGFQSIDTASNLVVDQVLNHFESKNRSSSCHFRHNKLNKSLLEQNIKTATIEKFSNQT